MIYINNQEIETKWYLRRWQGRYSCRDEYVDSQEILHKIQYHGSVKKDLVRVTIEYDTLPHTTIAMRLLLRYNLPGNTMIFFTAPRTYENMESASNEHDYTTGLRNCRCWSYRWRTPARTVDFLATDLRTSVSGGVWRGLWESRQVHEYESKAAIPDRWLKCDLTTKPHPQ